MEYVLAVFQSRTGSTGHLARSQHTLLLALGPTQFQSRTGSTGHLANSLELAFLPAGQINITSYTFLR